MTDYSDHSLQKFLLDFFLQMVFFWVIFCVLLDILDMFRDNHKKFPYDTLRVFLYLVHPLYEP